MTSNNQVSPVIRISQENRDASARATHLEAATRKFLVTTNERKQMSTKTNFKRIALVAVAALGLGVLSSVPSQATIEGTPTVTVENGTAGITGQASDSTTAATISIRYFAATTADTANVTLTLGTTTGTSNYTLGSGANLRVTSLDTSSSTGVTTTTPALTSADSQIATTLPTIAATANSFAEAKFGVHLDSSAAGTRGAGTYTINYIVRFFDAGSTGQATTKTVTGTFNIVVTDGAAAAAGSLSAAGTSTAVLSDADGSPTVAGVDDVVSFPASSTASPAGTLAANIKLTQLTSAGLPARESITVTTTIGNVGLNSGSSRAKSATFQSSTNGIDTINIYSDGSSGDAVITVKTPTVTFAAKTVNFYSTSVDKYVVTRLAKVIGSGSTVALVVTAVDASGNVIKESSNSTVYAYSDNLAAIATATTAASGQSCSGYLAAFGGHYCSFSGSSNGVANITIRNKSTLALSTKASTATAITVNLNPAVKVALSFDKATYAPGELAYLSVSAVDASGAPVGPNAGTNYLATGGITATAAFGNGSASTDSFTATTLPMNVSATGRVTDVALYTLKVYMPSSGGAISASATGGTALSAANQVKVTATATVTDNGAAALAAVTALATTVASLKTLITTLTNLVLKIQKKVKA